MIDWDRVRELNDEVGEDAFDEVVALFLEEVDEVVARLRASPEPARFEEDLHFLKGSAINIGFQNFGQLCQIGELQAATGKAAAVDLATIFDTYETSKREFLARIAEGLAA